MITWLFRCYLDPITSGGDLPETMIYLTKAGVHMLPGVSPVLSKNPLRNSWCLRRGAQKFMVKPGV